MINYGTVTLANENIDYRIMQKYSEDYKPIYLKIQITRLGKPEGSCRRSNAAES